MPITLSPDKFDRVERMKRAVSDALPDPPYQFDGIYAMAVARNLYPEDSWERGFAPMLVLRAFVIADSPDDEVPGLTAR